MVDIISSRNATVEIITSIDSSFSWLSDPTTWSYLSSIGVAGTFSIVDTEKQMPSVDSSWKYDSNRVSS